MLLREIRGYGDDFRSDEQCDEAERRDFHSVVAAGGQDLGKVSCDERVRRSGTAACQRDDLDVK